MKTKECSKCEETKPISEFHYQKKRGTYRSDCKKCGNEMSKSYKMRNKKHISSYNHEYKKEHKDEIKKYNKNYNINNRETIQKRQTIYQRKKKEIDPSFRMGLILRRRLAGFINGNDNKSNRKLFGCNHTFFIKWMEFQFSEEMNFDNRGDCWHMDHVDPCNTFDLTDEEEQKLCFHWSNTRPLEAEENLSRSDDTDEEEIKKHKKVVKKFLKSIEDDDENLKYTLL